MPTRVRFGVFELDVDEGTLRRNGRHVPVQPQPLRALTTLVSNPGRLVSRGELSAAIWPGDTHVDFERGLNYCIRYLRALLGDEARSPHFIETVPRRGYRFIAPVLVAATDPASSRMDRRPVGRVAGIPWRWLSLPVVAAAVALVAPTGFRPHSRSLVAPPGAVVAREAPTGRDAARALDLYLKGRYQASQLNQVGLLAGVESFRAALAVDPGLTVAHAGVAASYDHLGLRRTIAPRIAFKRAAEAARRALAADQALAEAYAALGLAVMYLDFDWPLAGQALHRSIEIEPERAQAHIWLAIYYTSQGRPDLAIEAVSQARRLEPDSRDVAQLSGWFHYFARRYDDAISECRRTLELEPRWSSAYRCIEAAQMMSGRYDEAVETHSLLLALSGRPDLSRDVRDAYSSAGLPGVWRADLAAAQADAQRGLLRHQIDLLAPMVRLGMTASALDAAERMVNDRDLWVPFLGVDPALASLRSHPRFQRLLRAIGLGATQPADVD